MTKKAEAKEETLEERVQTLESLVQFLRGIAEGHNHRFRELEDVAQEVKQRWHLDGPPCRPHGRKNCRVCYERERE